MLFRGLFLKDFKQYCWERGETMRRAGQRLRTIPLDEVNIPIIADAPVEELDPTRLRVLGCVRQAIRECLAELAADTPEWAAVLIGQQAYEKPLKELIGLVPPRPDAGNGDQAPNDAGVKAAADVAQAMLRGVFDPPPALPIGEINRRRNNLRQDLSLARHELRNRLATKLRRLDKAAVNDLGEES